MSWFCDAHRAEHVECGHSSIGPHDHCTFNIWAPDRHTSINNLAFSAYTYHQQKIEDYINLLAADADPNDPTTQYMLLDQVGLSPYDLTSSEIEYIEREVANRS